MKARPLDYFALTDMVSPVGFAPTIFWLRTRRVGLLHYGDRNHGQVKRRGRFLIDGKITHINSARENGAWGQDRTDDTRFFRPVLYWLSYPGFKAPSSPRAGGLLQNLVPPCESDDDMRFCRWRR